MGFLYVNTKGNGWRKHSYSAGNDFDSCPLKYYLRRVLGWKTRDVKAAFKFGRALEEAIQFFHENEKDPVEDFLRRWAAHESNKDLVFTKTEKSWETLKTMGEQMMRLYIILQPKLPIPLGTRSVWQREYAKEVFPGDPVYGEIEDAGKLDIIAYADPGHSLLSKMEWKIENGIYRPVIVDIKTTAVDFPEMPGIAAFDKQLRRYAWLSGIQDVALLSFKKVGLGLSKGVSASILEGPNAGMEVVVANVEDNGVWIVRNDYFVDEMDKAQGRKADGKLDTTKAAVARKREWLENNAALVPPTCLTRQRIQFNSGRVTKESAEDAGMIAARQITEIVNCWRANKWPNTFGIRYPSDDRNDPYFRAFVLEDKMFKNQNFIKTDEESFNDLFEEEEEAE